MNLRRQPREVYRVYDEDAFLADVGHELGEADGSSARWLAILAGSLVLAVGAASVLEVLLASGAGTPAKGTRRRPSGAAGSIPAALARPVEPTPAPRRAAASSGLISSPPLRRWQSRRPQGHAAAEALRVGPGRSPFASAQMPAGPPASAPRLLGVAHVASAPASEFGFERGGTQ